MFEIKAYISSLTDLFKQNFETRLLYIGLQGSYLRNDADEKSDIDIMVVLDDISVNDLALYKNIIIINGNNDRSCGFICGKSELQSWNPLEICQIIHTTKDYYGKLAELVPAYTKEDEKNYIKLSLNNLYHEICHRYIHASREKNIEKLPHSYKYVFFILQNIYFYKSGIFVPTKQKLLTLLKPEDKKVLSKALELKNQQIYNFDQAFQILFEWCKKTMQKI